MPLFNIFTETPPGVTLSREVYVSGDDYVELSDTEVQQLVNLIRENNGATDVDELELEKRFPEIYEKLDDVCRDIAHRAAYYEMVIDGYENGWYDVDMEDAISKCEEKYGFKCVFDLDKIIEDYYDGEADDINSIEDIDEDTLYDVKMEAFEDWIGKYRKTLKDEEEEASFLEDVFELEPEVDNVDYEVVIPADIIKMSKEH